MLHCRKVLLATILLIVSFTLLQVVVFAQSESHIAEWEKMHKSKKLSLEEFNDSKFGMFIHWGLYSKPAGIWKGKKIGGLGEWIMYHAQINRDEYRAIAKDFNPEQFNAEEWVKLAKQAGMKYIVAMPKHHDGFSMYGSKVTDYNIVEATPFRRDPMEELYKACKKYGINFSIYYSHATDWMDGGDAGVADYLATHPSEKEKSKSDKWVEWPSNKWDPAPVSFTEYLEKKAKPQMQELLHKFPGMQEIWYDVPKRMTGEQSFDFYKMVYDIQPNCLVNSRVGNGLGDFWIPGDNIIPKSGEGENVYWETPGTLNNTWGIKNYDTDWKSVDELLYWLTEITSKGGNYLLNVGPTSEGLFPEESIKQLKAIGDWMSINGESVYGTCKWRVNHEGPYSAEIKGTSNREKEGFNAGFTSEDFWFSKKDNIVYATSLKWPEAKNILIKAFASSEEKIVKVRLLGSKSKLKWEQDSEGLKVSLPEQRPHVRGYVLKIIIQK
ncbi:alpha-L-fucosidase [Maribellus maritimus]|uniref:alpha-L-fucosidase n=1 Tax=Maribellus maritimus TaxID=2870838 RepID=UPI001EEBE912|nr:alpha-L-fucosidase [Maribellus maritimus]MCG6190107.1 alpha-L-fucosidase [Maribellus maritimus]